MVKPENNQSNPKTDLLIRRPASRETACGGASIPPISALPSAIEHGASVPAIRPVASSVKQTPATPTQSQSQSQPNQSKPST
jgi:hypothetical protein